jgi:hypothetical protein
MATNIIPSDSPSVFEALNTLETSSPGQYAAIVRPNNPPPGIGGFLFDIPGDEELRLKSAISRHYVENNTPISDHIALEPEMITLRGVVAEIATPTAPQKAVNNVVGVLPICAPMVPTMSAGVVAKMAAIVIGTVSNKAGGIGGQIGSMAAAGLAGGGISSAQMQATVTGAVAQTAANLSGLPAASITSLLGLISSGSSGNTTQAMNILCASASSPAISSAAINLQILGAKTPTSTNQSVYNYFANSSAYQTKGPRQSNASLFFQQAWWGRQLMSVETPWGIFNNMAIAEIRAVQPKESKWQTDMTVIFEKIRVVGDISTKIGQLADRNAIQSAPQTQIGNAGMTQPTTSQSTSLYVGFSTAAGV